MSQPFYPVFYFWELYAILSKYMDTCMQCTFSQLFRKREKKPFVKTLLAIKNWECPDSCLKSGQQMPQAQRYIILLCFHICVSEMFSVYYFWMEGNSDQSQHTGSANFFAVFYRGERREFKWASTLLQYKLQFLPGFMPAVKSLTCGIMPEVYSRFSWFSYWERK